ncbi:MAG: hypothetical protein U0T74_10120 [Chitinophagales bacterium]
MKLILAFIASSFAMLSVNSCKECTTCTKYPAPDIKLCKKDYASTESYNEAFRQTTAQGYTCD